MAFGEDKGTHLQVKSCIPLEFLVYTYNVTFDTIFTINKTITRKKKNYESVNERVKLGGITS